MTSLIQGIGLFIIIMGIMVLVNPKIPKRMMAFWKKGNNIYLGGAIRILAGIVFLYYTPRARIQPVIFVLGILGLLGGLVLFALGPKKAKAILERMEKKPDNFFRLISLAILCLGGLIVYSA